jgi:hypothetical protein
MPRTPGTIPGRPETIKKWKRKKLEEQDFIQLKDARKYLPSWSVDAKLTPSKKRKKHNIGGRANLLEEMGRIDARKHPDAADRAEKRRVIGELNRGYKSGGAVLKGKKVGIQIK